MPRYAKDEPFTVGGVSVCRRAKGKDVAAAVVTWQGRWADVETGKKIRVSLDKLGP